MSVLPAHVVRFFGQYEAVHRAVRAGALGDLAVLRFVRGGSRPDGAWFLDESQSGGIVFDLMVHDLDQARWLAGEVRTVHAVQNPASSNGQVPPEVVAHATLVHDTGAISQIQSFWGSPGFTFGPSFDVAGSAGRLVSSPDHEVTVFEDLPGLEAEQSYLPPETAEESPYFTQIEEFSRALLDDAPVPGLGVGRRDGGGAGRGGQAVDPHRRAGGLHCPGGSRSETRRERRDAAGRRAVGGSRTRRRLPQTPRRTRADVAVCFSDPDAPATRSTGASRSPSATGARWVEDPAELLAGSDAVVVCSENTRHHDDVMAALAQGCHVLCEKPMATTAADAVDMWRTAGAPGWCSGSRIRCGSPRPTAT